MISKDEAFILNMFLIQNHPVMEVPALPSSVPHRMISESRSTYPVEVGRRSGSQGSTKSSW